MIHENEKSALLVMDVQPGIIDMVQTSEEYLAKLCAAVAEARKRHMLVIQVVVGFRPGAPEANERQREHAGRMIDPQPVMQLEAGDVVVTKRRVSAFSGSDLAVILSAQNIRHLVLAGIATSGVVLSTVREASDKDFKITVLADLCADRDQEVHTVLTTKVFPRQATVMTGEEWIKAA